MNSIQNNSLFSHVPIKDSDRFFKLDGIRDYELKHFKTKKNKDLKKAIAMEKKGYSKPEMTK